MSKSVKSLIAIILVLVVSVIALFPATVFAEDDESDLSLYTVASSAASYYDAASSVGEVGMSGILGKLGFTENFNFLDADVEAANAGGMIGFIDSDKSSFFGWAASMLSNSSQAYSYDSFKDYPGMYEYAYYGYTLQKLGLDSTSNETLDINAIARGIGGGMMMCVYVVSGAVNLVFNAALVFLQWVNPFHWFADSTVLDGKAGTDYPTWASGIVDFVSNMYDSLDALGWVVMPIFLVVLLVSLLLFRKSQTSSSGSKVKRFLIRLCFLVIGIPLLGSLYTSCLTWAQSEVAAGATSTDYVIASTFVDFESWASNGNLQIPSGDKIVVETGLTLDNIQNDSSGTASNSTSVRRLARDINDKYSGIQVSTSTDNTDVINWNIEAAKDTVTNVNTLWSGLGTDNYQACINLLSRYATSQYYHSSDYETEWKSSINNGTNEEGLTIDNVSDQMSVLADFKEFGSEDGNGKGLFISEDSGAESTTFLNNGNLGVSAQDNGTSSLITYTNGSDNSRGLSTLSMYNYLNTSFGESGLVVYSTNKATSGLVREAHHAVTIVGDGFTSILYYLDAFLMLLAMTVIGIGYAFAIMFGTIKRGIKMIINLPLAMVGSIKSIARIVAVVIMMVINVFVTIIMYDVVQELLVSLSEMIETPFADAMDAVDGVTSTMSPMLSGTGLFAAFSPAAMSVITIIELILVIIGTIVFTIMAFKLRKKAVHAVDEAVGQLLDKLFGETGSMPSSGGSGFVQKAAGAVGAGAGMALGQKLMGNMMSPGSPETVSGSEQADSDSSPGETESAAKGDSADVAQAAEAAQALGGAVNPSGSVEAVSDGGSIQDGEKQTLAEHSSETSGDSVSSDESDGRDIMAQNADSLADANNSSDNAQDEMHKQVVADDIESEAKADAAKGVGKTVKGAVEAGVGAYTGNEQLMKKGIEDAADGVNKTKDAAEKGANADAEAEKQVKAEQTENRDNTVNEKNGKTVANDDNFSKSTNRDESQDVDRSKSDDVKKNLSAESNSYESETESKMKGESHDKMSMNSSTNVNAANKVAKGSTVTEKNKTSGSHGNKGAKSQSTKSPRADKNGKSKSAQKQSDNMAAKKPSGNTGQKQAQGNKTAQQKAESKSRPTQSKTATENSRKQLKNKINEVKTKYDNLSPTQKKVLNGAAMTATTAVASKVSDKASKKSSNDDFI